MGWRDRRLARRYGFDRLAGQEPRQPSVAVRHADAHQARAEHAAFPLVDLREQHRAGTEIDYLAAGARAGGETGSGAAAKTSAPKGGNNNPNGPRGWHPAAARLLSSAAPATKASTQDA